MGDAFLAWSDGKECPGPPLTPWERHWARELLVRVDGRQRYTRAVLRVARQQGKTYVVQRVLLWLLVHGHEWLGEPQRILNTHFDGIQAVGLMEPMARACGYGAKGLPGLRSQTYMAVWHPGGEEDGLAAVWMARAMTTNALTGNQGITVSFVDELQDAKRRQVQEGLGGSMSGARIAWRLRIYAGTGEKEDSDLLRELRKAIGDPSMFWSEWSLPPGADPDDEGNWPWASPDWSDARLAYLREEKGSMPLDEFQRNYLLLDGHQVQNPDALVAADVWDALRAPQPQQWAAAAVEAGPGASPVVALAAHDQHTGAAVVSARRASSTAEAVQWCQQADEPPIVGKSLLADPAWAAAAAVPATGSVPEACGQLLALIRDGVLRHDGGELLAEQVTRTTVEHTADGLRITSRGRVDAIKAAVRAVHAARQSQDWFSY
jgi:hypothetical protein